MRSNRACRIIIALVCAIGTISGLAGCASVGDGPREGNSGFDSGAHQLGEDEKQKMFSRSTSIEEVVNDSAFDGKGRLLFPVDQGYMQGDTLGDISLAWYNFIDPDETVAVMNTLHEEAQEGVPVILDIYAEEEIARDPSKANTGLIFFRGKEGAKTAVCNAGGGFAYAGAVHDSFPVAFELSKIGYNAFALIYRPEAQTACEDLSRAIAYLFEHKDELQIDMNGYSLWGGSAGARMAAWVGAYGTQAFGEPALPKPAAVIMEYTGFSEVTGDEPPTYNVVGTADGIADWRVMSNRIERIKANGTDAEIEVFEGLPHGFGLGTCTAAEGWIDRAVEFWKCQDEDSERYRGFLMDQTIDVEGELVHYNVFVPSDLNHDEPISLFVTLPGYQGLYFQGVGQNLYTEDFAFAAQEYRSNMIVLAPQLSDWGATSAEQTISLTERFQKMYRIAPDSTFVEGCSGGGETLSIILGMRPDLFARALICSTQWDGDLSVLANAEVPVYMVVGEGDEYYSSAPLHDAYEELRGLYLSKGLSDSRINQLVILDVKEAVYFSSEDVSSQHGDGARLFSNDKAIMEWLFC